MTPAVSEVGVPPTPPAVTDADLDRAVRLLGRGAVPLRDALVRHLVRLGADPAAADRAADRTLGQQAAVPPRSPRRRAPVAAVPFARVCEAYGLPAPVPEFRFHDTRRWRFDWAWPDHRVALEVDGGIGFGRHTRPGGWDGDTEKLNTAQAMGWRVLRCRPRTRDTAATLDALRRALAPDAP